MGLFSFRRRAEAPTQAVPEEPVLAMPERGIYLPDVREVQLASSPKESYDFDNQFPGLRFASTVFDNFGVGWPHRVIFNGATIAQAQEYTRELADRLTRGAKIPGADYQELLDNALNELSSNHWQGKEFYSPIQRIHELRQRPLLTDYTRPWSAERAVQNVHYAYLKRQVLEFGYTRERKVGGGKLVTSETRRVHVTDVYPKGFQGRDHRGIRHYKFERMAWGLVDTGGPSPLDAPPYLQLLLLESSRGEVSMSMSFGLLASGGAMGRLPLPRVDYEGIRAEYEKNLLNY